MKYFWLLVVIILFSACENNVNNKNSNFSVTGIVKNIPENTLVKLFYSSNNGNIIIDSVLIKHSSFELNGRTSGLDFYGLEFSGNPYLIYLLVDSADNIKVNADFNNIQLYSVENSPSSFLIQQLEKHLYETNLKIGQKIKNHIDFSEDMKKQKEYSKDFILKNSQSPACIIAFSQKFLNNEIVLPIDENFELYKKAEKNLRRNYAQTDFFLKFNKFIKNYEIILERNKKNKQKVKPEKLLDFTVKTINDKNFNFKKFVNSSPVLLVFWSSWSVSCIENNIIISKIEKKYPNLKIVQISFDSNIEILKDTLKKYNFNHVLINDTLVWKSNLVNKYDIEELPTNILINSKGEIEFFTSNPNELVKEIGKLK